MKDKVMVLSKEDLIEFNELIVILDSGKYNYPHVDMLERIKQALTPPTVDEIVKEFQKTRTYETVVYRDCGDFALLNDKTKGHYELSNIYCIVSKNSLNFPFGTTLKLANKITTFFMNKEAQND